MQIDKLTARIEALIAAIPAAAAPAPADEHRPDGGEHASGHDTDTPQAPVWLPALQRLQEIPGIGPRGADTQ